MKHFVLTLELGFVVLLMGSPWARAQQGDYLTSAEQDQLRDAQDPSERIKVYLSLLQLRLDRSEGLFDNLPGSNPGVDTGDQRDRLLDQYLSIDDELKDWIDDQYDRNGDMRAGLRQLLDVGPKQLQELQHIQGEAGPESSVYQSSLRDAIADLNDTLDGATKALQVQQKKFPEMQRDAKKSARDLKQEQKEQKKRNKEEQKLRKQHKGNDNSSDSDDN